MHLHAFRALLAGGLIAGLAFPFAPAHAGDYLLGGWGGERARLAERGAVFGFDYTSELAHNARGGDRHITRHAGQLALDAALDLDKLWGWSGSAFRLTVTGRNGHNLSDDANLGTLQQVQEVYGRGQTWRLTQMWFSQELFGERLNVKLGRLGVGADFAAFSCHFMNLTFCGSTPGNIVGNYWYNWPVSQWGIVAKGRTSANTYVQIGAYQINPAYLLKTNAIRPNNPAGTVGTLIPVEFGWTPALSDGLEASYKIGGWYNTANNPDVHTDVHGGSAALSGLPFEDRDGAYGAYLNAEQQLSKGHGDNPQSGMRTFFNVTQADRNTSVTDRQIALGLIYTGLTASLPDDNIGLAVGMTHVNGRVARYQRETNSIAPGTTTVQGNEFTTELFYTWNPLGWLSLRPNAQYIRHLGGSRQNGNAAVIGLKANVAF
jgi:porin